MAEEQKEEEKLPQPSDPPLPFDPSRMVGIIKRKALIKDLAAAYHAECLQYCQDLLELQTKWEECDGKTERSVSNFDHRTAKAEQPFIDLKPPEESKKEPVRPSKRVKKLR